MSHTVPIDAQRSYPNGASGLPMEADYTEISLVGHRKSDSEHLRESPGGRRDS